MAELRETARKIDGEGRGGGGELRVKQNCWATEKKNVITVQTKVTLRRKSAHVELGPKKARESEKTKVTNERGGSGHKLFGAYQVWL